MSLPEQPAPDSPAPDSHGPDSGGSEPASLSAVAEFPRTRFAAVDETGAAGPRFLNRELSWVDFNRRVLQLAADPGVPLLERAKFLAIVSSNLDEFYEVRVAGIKDQVAAEIDLLTVDGLTPLEQLTTLTVAVNQLVATQSDIEKAVLAELRDVGISVIRWNDLNDDDRRSMQDVFDDGIFPVLTPLAVDPGHPFPYISNLSLNLAAMVRDVSTGQRRFARVKVPPLLPRFVMAEDGTRFLPLEQLIANQLDSLFPGLEVESVHTFRVTRNTDLDLDEDEAEDLLAAVEMELRRRRFGRAVRLEISADASREVIGLLLDELELDRSDVVLVDGLLDLTAMNTLHRLPRPELKDEPWPASTQLRLQSAVDDDVDIFAVIRDGGDLFVHHPYDSFLTSVDKFISQAAADPDVLTIKLTLYRTSGDSPIVKSLIEAAEQGKQVAVLVEVKARFDEMANIAWARQLERAGVHVAYGLVGLKTHTKIALVIRSEAEGLKRYVHIATGNYNSSTARLYTDFGLFTTHPGIGDDATRLFNSLTGYGRPATYRHFVVAPNGLRPWILDSIAREHPTESRGPGRIIMKMNSLVDSEIIEALYAASQAGVTITLIVRGICCLRPGVPGMSDNITVRSIVGRYLEHARVMFFENHGGDGQPGWFIGSADLMPRNLDRRVEAVVGVMDQSLCNDVRLLTDLQLSDTLLAWELGHDGTWVRLSHSIAASGLNCQVESVTFANERARRPLS
jgi:polyphosphate kinase